MKHWHWAAILLLVIGVGVALVVHASGPSRRGLVAPRSHRSVTTATTTATVASGTNCLRMTKSLGFNAFETPLLTSHYPNFAALDACGYPSPNTAGVPPGSVLTTVSTSCGCLPANTTYSNGRLDVNGPTTIRNLKFADAFAVINTSAGVTFINDLIRCSDCNTGGSIIVAQGHSGVTVKFSTIGGSGGGANCTSPASSDIITETSMTLTNDVFDCSGEPLNGEGYAMTNSYVIVDGYPVGSHNEALYQPGGGHNDLQHNTLLDPLRSAAVLFEDSKKGRQGLTRINNNLISGAGYGDGAIAGGGGGSSGVRVTNNRFSAAYGSTNWGSVCSNTVWTGNYLDSNRSAVSIPSTGATC